MPTRCPSRLAALPAKKPLVLAIGLLSIAVALSGCSSGGSKKSGGDDGVHEPDPSPSPSPAPAPAGDIRIGIVDSGFRITHEAIANDIESQINLLDFSADVSTETSHGTAVAGIAIETSPESRLMLAKVAEDGSGGSAATNVIDYGVYHLARNGARVINASYSARHTAPHVLASYNGVNSLSGLQEIVTSNGGKGSVYVVSAGNDGEALTSSNPIHQHQGIFARMLLSGGTYTNGNRHASSNYPGSDEAFQSRFLLAPWTTVAPHDSADDAYAYWGGTSMSAPQISGYAAEILHLWPHLAATQVTDLLLDTADRSHALYGDNSCGDSGTENCGLFYMGQGVADLNQALQPQGEIYLPEGDHVDEGGSAPAASTLAMSSAYGAGERTALSDVAVFDELGRDYRYDLSAGIRHADRYDQDRREAMGRLSAGQGSKVTTQAFEGRGFRMSQTFQADATLLASRFDADLSGMTLSGFQFAGGQRNPMDVRAESGFMPMMSLQGGDAVTNELGDVLGFAIRRPVADSNWTLQTSHWQGEAEGSASAYAARHSTASLAWSPVDEVNIEVGVGQRREENGVMGATGQGQMRFGANNDMTAYQASLAYRLSPQLSGFATYESVQGDVGGSGMMQGIKGLKASEMAIGLQWQAPSHQLALTFSQPSRIESGSLSLDVPVGRTLDGMVLRETREMEVSPEGRQRDIEIAYAGRLSGSSQWQVNLMHSLEPGHDPRASNDTSAVISIEKQF